MATGLGIGFDNPVYYWTGQASNLASSVDSALNTFTLGAASFSRDGDSIQFEFWGTFGGDTGVQITLKAGTSTLMDTDVIDPGADGWVIRGRFIRTSSTSQKCYASFITDGSGLSTVFISDTTFNMGSAITFTLNGLGVAVDDLKLNGVYYTLSGRPS